jgi:hypothetical protein
VRGIGREAVVEGCDAGKGRRRVGEDLFDGGFSAGGGLEGVAPGAAVDVANGLLVWFVQRWNVRDVHYP